MLTLFYGLMTSGLALGAPLAAPALQDADATLSRPLPRAEELIGEHACTACHDPGPGGEQRYEPKLAPLLAKAGARLDPGWLREYLGDPQGSKTWSSMPNLLAKLPEAERAEVTEGLVHFLVGLGGPGEAAAEPVDMNLLERGRRLFHEVGCVACHQPQEELWEFEASVIEFWEAEEAGESLFEVDEDLEEEPLWVPPGTPEPPSLDLAEFVAEKYTAAALTDFLLDPLALRPGGHMPNMGLEEGEARAIALYLLRERAKPQPGGPVRVPGLGYELFEVDGRAPRFESDEPVATGSTPLPNLDPMRRDQDFGLRFEGFLELPEAGAWTFATRSDDGSHLWIDGELVVDNGGTHAPQLRSGEAELSAGSHTIKVTFFERGGGESLEVLWSSPSTEELEPIPAAAFSHLGLALRPLSSGDFEWDLRLARKGQAYFSGLGCVACHDTGIDALDRAAPMGTAAGRPLAELAGLEPAGCLRPSPQAGGEGGGGARFRFPAEDLALLDSYLGSLPAASEVLGQAERIDRHLQRMNCTACHRRGDFGGVHPERKDYFVADEEAELGDESRYPPPLTGVGAKLQRPALEAVLLDGDGVRPYVKARMPQFGAHALGWLGAALEEVDLAAAPASASARGDDLDPMRVAQAQHLTGREGLGCIQCHDFGGVASLGIRAVDMARMHERLRPDWFRRLLMDPAEVNMNTRMANLWVDGASPVADVLDGDPGRQVQLIWDYLSLGEAMPYPEGLVVPDSDFAVQAADRVESVGVFWKQVGPRVVAVGNPERLHFAFDVGHSRMDQIWRGSFFNARGTWQGRAGQLETSGSSDVLHLPEGLLLAQLAEPSAPWPKAGKEGTSSASIQPQALGRVIDPTSGRPGFRYAIGDLQVTENLEPIVQRGGAAALRRVDVQAKVQASVTPWIRLAQGTAIEALPDGSFRVTGDRTQIIWPRSFVHPPRIVEVDGGAELRAELALAPARAGESGPLVASYVWEIQW